MHIVHVLGRRTVPTTHVVAREITQHDGGDQMEIKLKGRDIPRDENGDACFTWLEESDLAGNYDSNTVVLNVFNKDEVVELVNRAIYQLEYQRESHKKRGAKEREQRKLLKAALAKEGKKPLKGE